MALLTVARFKTLSVMPREDINALETSEPGFVAGQIWLIESEISDRLRKRYVVPFDPASPPPTVIKWMVIKVTLACYQKRGWNAESAQDQQIFDAAVAADAQILEAANSETGLFELPLRADAPGTSGASKPAPFGYSEASPYVSHTIQAQRAREEDFNGRGS